MIQTVQYHPNGQLLLTASLDKRLRFFSVDGGDNPLVQSVYLADMPVRRASFAAGGAKVLATGRRKFFYLADLETAKLERIPGLFGVQDKSLEGFIASPSAAVDGAWRWAGGRESVLPCTMSAGGQPPSCPLLLAHAHCYHAALHSPPHPSHPPPTT